MRSRILSLPAVLQPLVIIGSTVVAAFVVSLLTRSLFKTPHLELDMGLTSAVYGTLGTIYAVLIAFVVSGVWQSFTNAGSAVSSEANALADLLFIVGHMPVDKSTRVRKLAKVYVESVIERWDALVKATIVDTPVEEITLDTSSALLQAILDLEPRDGREHELYGQSLRLAALWLDARRNRLRSARGNTAKALWGLLIGGAFVLFAFHGMFVTHAWGIWAGLLLGFSLIVGLAFYLIFSLDSPFSGQLSAGPEPFLWVLKTLHRFEEHPHDRPAELYARMLGL